MSQENVEILRRGIDAWNRGDIDEWLTGFAPEAEWHTTGRFADEGVYRGRAGLERFWSELREDLEELSVSPTDIRASGDRVFVAAMTRGRGKLSRADVEQLGWLVVSFRDGLVVRVETYADPAQALEAAGLRE
jgi:ketosteroid isomerase-like protein